MNVETPKTIAVSEQEVQIIGPIKIRTQGSFSRRQVIRGVFLAGEAALVLAAVACSKAPVPTSTPLPKPSLPAPEIAKGVPNIATPESPESLKQPVKDTLTSFRYGCLYNGTSLDFIFNRARLNRISEERFLNMRGMDVGLGLFFDPGILELTKLVVTNEVVQGWSKIHQVEQGFPLRDWYSLTVDVDTQLRRTLSDHPNELMPNLLRAFSENLSIRCVEIMITAISRHIATPVRNDKETQVSTVYKMNPQEAGIVKQAPLPFQVLLIPNNYIDLIKGKPSNPRRLDYLLLKTLWAKSLIKFEPLEITNPDKRKSKKGELLCTPKIKEKTSIW